MFGAIKDIKDVVQEQVDKANVTVQVISSTVENIAVDKMVETAVDTVIEVVVDTAINTVME